MSPSRSHQLSILIAVLCVALLMAGCAPAKTPTSAPPGPTASGTLTFSSQPCGKLVAFQEAQAATGQPVNFLDIVEEGTCAYEDESGNAIVTVILATGGGQDCSSIGSDAEAVSGVGDQAAWSPASKTACVVKGDAQAQIVMGALAAGVDPKTAALALLTAAAGRMP
jgi:hypothetical protein